MFTDKHTRSQTSTMWPPAPRHWQRRLLFDSVSAGPDKVSRQPSTELVLPPADQLDISTQPTSPSQITLHNLLCTAVSYKWAVTHSVTQLAKLWSHASKDTDTHTLNSIGFDWDKEFKAALIIICTWIGQIMYNGNCFQWKTHRIATWLPFPLTPLSFLASFNSFLWF